MKFGIHFADFTTAEGESLSSVVAESAKAADAGGISLFTFMDHWFQIQSFGPPEAPMLEGYTALGFIAGQTERITISLLVTGVTYRHPGLLAKTVTTLDVLSSGRAMLGLGAAWYEREHTGLGVEFPPIAERFERLEETLQICEQMWSDHDGPYEGTHYRLAETICSPRPIQQPRPPIMVAGGGERKTLKLVARYADACNLFGTPDLVKHKLEVLARHCEAEGRDPAEIETTIIAPGDALRDTDAYLASMEEYARLGVDLVSFVPRGPGQVRIVGELAERVVPRLAEIAG